MKRVSLYLIFFLMCWSNSALESSSYHNAVFLGETQTHDYKGPLGPALLIKPDIGKFLFEDDQYFEEYLFSLTENETLVLKNMWFEEFVTSSCPSHFLSQNIQYIRYLFRLLSISYVFEGIKQQSIVSKEFGMPSRICNLDWDQNFSKCNPKSKDMKMFLSRAKIGHLRDFKANAYKKLNSSQISQWLKRNPGTGNVARYRLKKYCENFNCEDQSKVKNFIQRSCRRDRDLLQMFCSEKDDLYGASYLKLPEKLLLQSHILKVINEGGYGSRCLSRFKEIFTSREKEYTQLKYIFPLVYESLQGGPYIQGELFVPGALKEFDDRGLTDFLFVAPKPRALPKLTPTPKPIPIPTSPPKIVKVLKPIPKSTPTPTPKVKKTVEKVEVLSHFETQLNKLITGDLKRIKLDMALFKNDFVFTKKMLRALKGPLASFQTRQALRDMRDFDSLGRDFEPVRLIFLKYMIDQNGHKGLWSFLDIIGDKFYIVNDMDGKTKPILIHLHNSEETNSQWQITLLNGKFFKPSFKKKFN